MGNSADENVKTLTRAQEIFKRATFEYQNLIRDILKEERDVIERGCHGPGAQSVTSRNLWPAHENHGTGDCARERGTQGLWVTINRPVRIRLCRAA